MAEFFRMGGYAGYVWSCYGLTLVVLLGNLWFARRDLASQVLRSHRRNEMGRNEMAREQADARSENAS
jgi:heme exporter protein CcmD